MTHLERSISTLAIAVASMGAMSDAEIERLEPSLRAADEALAGGATITIATTTIIIVALIIIIILVA